MKIWLSSAVVIFWDAAFGTYFAPKTRESECIGVVDDTTPHGFVAQIVAPFVPQIPAAAAEPARTEA